MPICLNSQADAYIKTPLLNPTLLQKEILSPGYLKHWESRVLKEWEASLELANEGKYPSHLCCCDSTLTKDNLGEGDVLMASKP